MGSMSGSCPELASSCCGAPDTKSNVFPGRATLERGASWNKTAHMKTEGEDDDGDGGDGECKWDSCGTIVFIVILIFMSMALAFW